jgi:hypothetical protein
VLFTLYYYCDEIKDGHVAFIAGGKCWSEYLKRRDCLESRHRWEDIKMVLKEIGFEVEDWIELAQDKVQQWDLMNIIMNL